jgi:hypothetical protein
MICFLGWVVVERRLMKQQRRMTKRKHISKLKYKTLLKALKFTKDIFILAREIFELFG